MADPQLTPELLARLRYNTSRQADHGMPLASDQVPLIERIAAEKGWDLDEVEWVQHDGTKMKGMEKCESA
jgi:hypothetical protein